MSGTAHDSLPRLLRARAAYRWDDYSDGQSRGYPKGRRTEMWDVSGRTGLLTARK
ncbi:MAG: hypothetical protein Q8P59_12270 [Dehalococcoidia bacterium]|nr:hypothetical protein [Dehalococcoidia bacterium]